MIGSENMRKRVIMTATGLSVGRMLVYSAIYRPFISDLVKSEQVWAASNESSVKVFDINAVLVNDAINDGGRVQDDFGEKPNNLLSYAAYFHIFAREATLTAHTNGNLAVQKLDGRVNFGTAIHEGTLEKDIYYIENLVHCIESSFVVKNDTRGNKVVFGDSVLLNIVNGDVFADNRKINHLDPSELFQDKNNNKYINFDEMFSSLGIQSNKLSQRTPNAELNNDNFTDENNRVIKLQDYEPNERNEIVINLTAKVLAKDRPLIIDGISKEKVGTTVIINVDTEGQAEYSMSSPIKIKYNDGGDRGNKNTEIFDDNHLLWNFYDSNSSDGLYHGLIRIDATFQGSLLAPEAHVEAYHNFDGNIVANTVKIVNGESHRWDFQDGSDTETDFPDPEIPETPEVPEEPEEPEIPEVPEEPEIPEVPEEPEEPETPEVPEEPEELETPEVPEEPEEPETPEVPEVPEQPEIPEKPDEFEEPEVPDTPKEPENPGDSEIPEEPKFPEIEVPDLEVDPGLEPETDSAVESPVLEEVDERATSNDPVMMSEMDNDTDMSTEAPLDLASVEDTPDKSVVGSRFLPKTQTMNREILRVLGMALGVFLAIFRFIRKKN